MLGSNYSTIKEDNLALVLEAIRLRGPVSRTQLAEVTGLWASTISNITGDLLQAGLIENCGSVSAGNGRRRTHLQLKADAYLVVGVEISRTHISLVLTDLTAKILWKQEHACTPQRDAAWRVLVPAVNQCLHEATRLQKEVIGIGIGLPGPVDAERGVVIAPPNFAGWENAPLGELCRQQFGLSTFIDDDARTAALGESWFGAGQTVANLLYLSFGTGVGSGVVIGKQLYRGAHHLAGQIGHCTVNPWGERCDCGNTGCLELETSIPRLLAKLAIAGEDVDAGLQRAADNFARGDDRTREMLRQVSTYMQVGLTTAVNMYDPEVLIVGGRLCEVFPHLLEEATRAIRKRAFSFAAQQVNVAKAQLDKNASTIGAAVLVMERFFANPLQYLENAVGAVSR